MVLLPVPILYDIEWLHPSNKQNFHRQKCGRYRLEFVPEMSKTRLESVGQTKSTPNGGSKDNAKEFDLITIVTIY